MIRPSFSLPLFEPHTSVVGALPQAVFALSILPEPSLQERISFRDQSRKTSRTVEAVCLRVSKWAPFVRCPISPLERRR
jgi:hypothetical protein